VSHGHAAFEAADVQSRVEWAQSPSVVSWNSPTMSPPPTSIAITVATTQTAAATVASPPAQLPSVVSWNSQSTAVAPPSTITVATTPTQAEITGAPRVSGIRPPRRTGPPSQLPSVVSSPSPTAAATGSVELETIVALRMDEVISGMERALAQTPTAPVPLATPVTPPTLLPQVVASSLTREAAAKSVAAGAAPAAALTPTAPTTTTSTVSEHVAALESMADNIELQSTAEYVCTCLPERERACARALVSMSECTSAGVFARAFSTLSPRESVLFIGTQFSILYTFMYSPA